jgi:hypothetical protein
LPNKEKKYDAYFIDKTGAQGIAIKQEYPALNAREPGVKTVLVRDTRTVLHLPLPVIY